jgi:hypothetical protein
VDVDVGEGVAVGEPDGQCLSGYLGDATAGDTPGYGHEDLDS